MDIRLEEMSDFRAEYLERTGEYVEMSYFHYHHSYELFIILSGERKMILQDKIYQGVAGDVFLIPSQYIHRTRGGECARIVIDFTDNYLGKYFTEEMILKMMKCFDVLMITLEDEDFEEIKKISKQLCEFKNNKELSAIKLAEILMILSNKMTYNFENRPTSTSMILVSDILKYINSEYKNLSDIKKISEKFYISEEYLCRVFKKHTGVTVVSYINSLKLKAAEKLLTDKSKNITQVAEECGFSSAKYFGKLFKKNYGFSPLAYREEYIKKKGKMYL